MKSVWPRILERRGVPITESEVAKFEYDLGFLLPADYRSVLLATNGGQVVVDHEIPVEGVPGAFVHSLFAFSRPSPYVGIKEARRQQELDRFCPRQALAIANDMGTGEYYLMLVGGNKGAVYFLYHEDRESVSEVEWRSNQIQMPENMIKVASDFESLGELILAHSNWQQE